MESTEDLVKDDSRAQQTDSSEPPGPYSSLADIPFKPVVTIQGGRGWTRVELTDLWAHRDLFYFLIWRDVKVRYKQTALGVAWAILQPLLTMLVFTLLFGHLAGVPSDGKPYPIFVYAGLLPWNFFAAAVDNSSNSLVGNSALITKVYFPRLIIPSAAAGAALVDFAIASVILFFMCAYYGVAPSLHLLMLVPLTISMVLFAIAVGMRMSALNVKYRDIRYALPFMINIWMYATPVIYPVSFIPSRWRWMLMLNPLGPIVEGFRSAIFSHQFQWSKLSASCALVVGSLAYSLYSFRRTEQTFADYI